MVYCFDLYKVNHLFYSLSIYFLNFIHKFLFILNLVSEVFTILQSDSASINGINANNSNLFASNPLFGFPNSPNYLLFSTWLHLIKCSKQLIDQKKRHNQKSLRASITFVRYLNQTQPSPDDLFHNLIQPLHIPNPGRPSLLIDNGRIHVRNDLLHPRVHRDLKDLLKVIKVYPACGF